jgi:cell division septation protein DedD
MKNNETGEFELVLGNKQLLSGFFIVVILFGVFFTMGYIVGRNSAPSQLMAAGEQAVAGVVPQAARPRAAAAEPVAGLRDEDDPPAYAGTRPVRDVEAPEAAPLPEAAEPPLAEPPVRVALQPQGLIDPAPGEVYLQVMAVRRPEAEVVVKTLRDKGFRAGLGQGPNELMRVLVGPFHDAATLGQAKAGLENAGFQAIVRK